MQRSHRPCRIARDCPLFGEKPLTPIGSYLRHHSPTLFGEPQRHRPRLATSLLPQSRPQCFIPHASPGGKAEAIAREGLKTDKPLFTFDDPENQSLLALGARPYNIDAIRQALAKCNQSPPATNPQRDGLVELGGPRCNQSPPATNPPTWAAQSARRLRMRFFSALFSARSMRSIVGVLAACLAVSIRQTVSTRTPAASANSFCVQPTPLRRMLISRAMLARTNSAAGTFPWAPLAAPCRSTPTWDERFGGISPLIGKAWGLLVCWEI